MRILLFIHLFILLSSLSYGQETGKYEYSFDLKEAIIKRDEGSYKVLKLTLHKYRLCADIISKDEFYVVMNSIPQYGVTISDGVYTIESEIAVDPYYEAILPLNAFKKFKGSVTIYGPWGFVYTIKDPALLKIQPLEENPGEPKPVILNDDLKELNGRPMNAFVKKEKKGTLILRNLHLKSLPETGIDKTKLEVLDISGNCFFPTTVSDYINLRQLIGQNLFEETCGNFEYLQLSIDDLLKLKKLEVIDVTGISTDYIPESISTLPELKKINIWSGQYPLSILQSKINEVGIYTPLLCGPERENLSTIYYGKYYNSHQPVTKKIVIPTTGLFTNYYLNGQKLVEGSFSEKKPDGSWTFWFENGKLAQRRYYKNGKEDGQWVILNESGDSILIEHFTNGTLNTYERRYEKKDQLNGVYKTFNYSDTSARYTTGYYWKGEIMISTYISKPQSWTKETSFYPNKQKAIEITYNERHQFQGPFTTWAEDGKIKEEKNYSDGLLNGEQRYWNDLGKIYQKDLYDNGKLIKSEFVH